MDSRTNEVFIKEALDRADLLESYDFRRDEDQTRLCVLAAEVQRLRAKLNTIAFPRRGSPEAGWGVDEIGRFAAEELNGEREWLDRPAEEESAKSVDTDSFVEDALRDVIPPDFHPRDTLLVRLVLLVSEWKAEKSCALSSWKVLQEIDKAVPDEFKSELRVRLVQLMAEALKSARDELEVCREFSSAKVDAQGRAPSSPAAQQESFVASSEYFAKLMGLPPAIWRTFAEAEARRRYPDVAGEEAK